MPADPEVLWQIPLAHPGLGGLAVSGNRLLFGDRDLDDFHDVFRCLDADSGEPVWEIQRLAIAALDYGNSPRATPLVDKDRVYFASAHGLVLCAKLSDGSVIWERNLHDDFPPAAELPWGFCASPLLVAGKLIVNPGSPTASVVALDAVTGEVVWKCPGVAPGYGSLIAAAFQGQQQIIGHDAVSLGGWDVETGRRLWTVTPESSGDFNVPTPVVLKDQLLIATENNGARLFRFEADGRIAAEPFASNSRLKPDMSTPAVVGGKLFCVNRFLYCLDVDDGLKELWRLRDAAFGDYAAVFVSEDRLLILANGELLLVPTSGKKQITSRCRIFDDNHPIYSHAALRGKRLFVRGEGLLKCLNLW
ncbi:MAG: PQQ-binding-like beta-propeller repeat protein [Planctomycetaceae bacterium]